MLVVSIAIKYGKRTSLQTRLQTKVETIGGMRLLLRLCNIELIS